MYGRAARFRRAWYGRHPERVRRLTRPVISLGNLVVGGSGKTPLVAAIARELIAAGERPAILSRGYGRRSAVDGVVVVSDGQQPRVPAAESGDEPQMLARSLPGVPVLVAPDRYLAGALAERRFDCTVHILDDGFQHVQLARAIDLLLVSRADLDERVLPSGRLREPVDAARSATALLVNGAEDDGAAIASALGVPTVFGLRAQYDEPRLIEPFGEPLPPGTGRRVVAVAGIARPTRFFAALRAAGWDVARELVFRDHHWYTQGDLESMQRAADETKADLIVTTEKDAVRLDHLVARTLSGSRGEADTAFGGAGKARPARLLAYLPMQLAIEPAAPFAEWLSSRLRAARQQPTPEAA